MHNMAPKLSVMLYQRGTIDQMRDLSDRCVTNGIDSLYFPDHLVGGGHAKNSDVAPWLAMLPTMIDIAIRHPNVTVGPLVASPSLRPPAQLLVEAATTAHIVGSERFILSIGAGGAISDQELVGESSDKEGLTQRFEDYLKCFSKLIEEQKLRLASDFKLRVASDSVSTINLVSKYGEAWVTTGGWNKPLDARIEKINTLSKILRTLGFSGETAVMASISDGVTIDSSIEEVSIYAKKYDSPIDEIIIPLAP